MSIFNIVKVITYSGNSITAVSPPAAERGLTVVFEIR